MTEVVDKIQANLARNQNPTHKFTASKENSVGKSSQTFGFLSSGQREEVQKLLYKIKSTGRKVEDPKARIVMEDAESQDQIMTSLFSIDDQIHQIFELELKKELVTFVKTTAPLYNKMKSQLIEQLMQNVKKGYKCFPDDVIKRLQTNLAFGGKDIPENEFERVIVDSAGAELSSKANQAFHQTVTIASDYLYEKMHDQLVVIADDLSSEVALASLQVEPVRKQSEPGQAPSKLTSSASKPPQKAQPVPPAKGGAKVVPPPKPVKKSAVPTTNVENLEKIESNLEHATKERPTQSNKRPPTRKKRPAPPSQTTV